MIPQKDGEIKFWEAECFKIDPDTKKLHCRTNIGTNLEGNGEFIVNYDYLVIAVGARASTFNTPGVVEHCHFLKVIFHHHLFHIEDVDCSGVYYCATFEFWPFILEILSTKE